MFKIGDKVRCIEPVGKLVKHGVYTVSDTMGDLIALDDEDIAVSGWFMYRFELVQEAIFTLDIML